jgi:NADPH:quinone reductase-like Zn-dependent oxidoreductase
VNVISLRSFGDVSHFHLDKVPIPSPQIGEVRIRIKAVAFNPVDFKIRRGEYGGQTPLILGSDCSGIIDAIGDGVNQFAIGDEVYAMPFGQCSNGSYAQYLCLPYQLVAKKPINFSFEAAACIPLVSLTAYRATIGLQTLNRAGSLFIAGAAGGVGCMAVQLARHFHGGPIYTIARSEETANFLIEKLNIEENNIVISKDLELGHLKNKLIEINNGNLFSGTLDFVGKEIKALCISLTDYSGEIVSTVAEESDYQLPIWTNGSPYFQRSLSLRCIFVGAESFSGKKKTWEIYQNHFSHLNQLLENKTITIPYYRNLGVLCVETVQSAHELLESGLVRGKLVMKVS